jgi:hypothetical protein
MTFLLFNTHQPEKIAPKVEELLRKEIGAPVPLAYQILDAGTAGVTRGSLLSDAGSGMLGSKGTELFFLQFALPQPRPFELRVTINRSGIGGYVGQLSYVVRLMKPVDGEISLDSPRWFGLVSSKFLGNAEAVARLNKNGRVVKQANDLAVNSGKAGTIDFSIDYCLKILPHAAGTLLILNTVPVQTKMGLGMTLNLKKVFDFATLLDTAI